MEKTKKTKPKPYAFVVMPFHDDFKDNYLRAIKPACEEAGAFCDRVDEQIFEETILERVLNQIAKADLVVADVSGSNPNVLYETGYAHALGKRVILLTREISDAPFDLKPFPHIVYGSKLSYLYEELQRRVRFYLESPSEEEESGSPFEVEFYHKGERIIDKGELTVYRTGSGAANVYFDIYNPANQIIRGSKCQLALLSAEPLREWSTRSPFTRLGDSEFLTTLPKFPDIFPKTSVNYGVTITPSRQSPFKYDDRVSVTLRLSTEFGVKDMDLEFHVVDRNEPQRANEGSVGDAPGEEESVYSSVAPADGWRRR
jgi:hypothetical protein